MGNKRDTRLGPNNVMFTHLCSYLEPIDRAAVDERRELAEAVAERVSDGTHGEHDVQLVAAALDEHVEERHRGPVRLLRLVPLPVKHTQPSEPSRSRTLQASLSKAETQSHNEAKDLPIGFGETAWFSPKQPVVLLGQNTLQDNVGVWSDPTTDRNESHCVLSSPLFALPV